MSQVPTVRGPVEVADLGPTYMHEHIFVLTADVQQNYPGEWGIDDERIADAAKRLGALAASCYIDWIDPNVLPFLPQWHYLHIHDEVLPYTREHGVTDEQIATMLTANPRRFFEGTG